jgi:hypothetical protein
VLSIGPVATARGSDLIPNRVLRIAPVATARGSDLVINPVLLMTGLSVLLICKMIRDGAGKEGNCKLLRLNFDS